MDTAKRLLLIVLSLFAAACSAGRETTTPLPVPVMIALQQAQQRAIERVQAMAADTDAQVSPEDWRTVLDAAFAEPRQLVAGNARQRVVVEAVIEAFHRALATSRRFAIAKERFLGADANWPIDLDAARRLAAEADRLLHEAAAFRAFWARYPEDTQKLLEHAKAERNFATGMVRGMRQGGDPTRLPVFVATVAYAEAVRARCRVLLDAPAGWRFDRDKPGHPDATSPAPLREAFAAAVRTARERFAELVVATIGSGTEPSTP